MATNFLKSSPSQEGKKEWKKTNNTHTHTLSIREYLLQILRLLQALPTLPQEKAAGTAVPMNVNREHQHRPWGRQLPLCLE